MIHEESKVSKFVVFKIADYLLALPLINVLKVVNYSPIGTHAGTPLLRTMGIVQLGKHTIRVLNLYEQLSSAGLPQLPLTQPFLLIARSAQGELCGIWLEEPPNLVELDNEMLRSTPKSDSVAVATPGSSRQYGTHEIISHVAVLSQDNFSTTIFLLDVNRVLNTALTEVS